MTQAVNITESGRRAFAAGIKATDNPFKIGSQARSLWSKGWNAAKLESLRAQDVFARALRSDDLDTTVKTIQDALGIKTGDVAAQEFSGIDRSTYATLNSYGRAEFL